MYPSFSMRRASLLHGRAPSRARLSLASAAIALSFAAVTSAQSPAPAPAEPASPPGEASSERAVLEAELARELPEASAAPNGAAPAPNAGRIALLDVSFDLLGVAGASTAREDEMRSLQGGGHDPKNHGFTLQNAELTLAGVVDPYLRGDAHIVLLIDEAGETVVELEEAYLTTLALPFNLQVMAGQFFTRFGRINPTHPHSWDFVDQPVVNTRFFGPDGMRSPGVLLSWLTPLPFFLELMLSAQNSQGETVPSFRAVAGESVAGRTLLDRPADSPADLAYLARMRASFDAGDALTLAAGASAIFGPNASGEDTRTELYGADIYLRWRPLLNDRGWPFAAFQSELIYRRYDAAAVADAGAELAPASTLDDMGGHAQLTWGFARPWVAAARYDYARGEDHAFPMDSVVYTSEADALRDERHRLSLALTYHPSEFSKVRLQYNHDRMQFASQSTAHAAYLQFEVLFGAHGAHQF